MRRGIPCMERIPTLIRPLELTLRVGSQARTIISAFCGSFFRQGGRRSAALRRPLELTLRVGSRTRVVEQPEFCPVFRAKKERPRGTLFLERKTGLEPATFGLGSRRSTIEPLPHGLRIVYNFLLGLSIERRQNGHKKEKRRPELQPDDVFMV